MVTNYPSVPETEEFPGNGTFNAKIAITSTVGHLQHHDIIGFCFLSLSPPCFPTIPELLGRGSALVPDRL